MTRIFTVPRDTAASQRRAADPALSAWVSANAGSGKTHVLTRRVLRLLLAGAAPESILCLTYTKAAAAEMRGRVARELGGWAILSEDGLDAALAGFGLVPDSTMRLRARTLFARALETPGGLKIVTIHAFCESVLHRFALEAGVPFGFSVIEEAEQDRMIRTAREAVLAGGLRGGAGAEAVETLFARMSDDAIGKAIAEALAETGRLRALLADPERARANLRRLVGHGGRSPGEIEAEMLAGRLCGPAELARMHGLCAEARGGAGFAARIAPILSEGAGLEAWLGAFLTEKRAVPRSGFPPKALSAADPRLAEMVLAEAGRLEALAAERATALLVERSEALLSVLGAILARYERDKRARARLDFDDLVARLAALLADPDQSAWVHYKLDAGIHHILVDESQDTNPDQWRVVEPLSAEFFSGEGQVDRPRTVFAVGDPKQSIYSFQGADPALFIDAGRRFKARAEAARKPFAEISLHTSFRTLRGVLAAVDGVCARPGLCEAMLSNTPIHHDTARAEPGGTVTLWPPIRQEKTEQPEGEWPLSAPENPERSAPRRIAMRIAREIRTWLDGGRLLASGRAMTPSDVMVLVQSRSALFHEIIRALEAENLPTPGADRLAVTRHIAVLDLMALADVLLNPADDLQLASLLRSPLFDLDEDELFAIARGRQGTLWQALGETALAAGRAAMETLAGWRGRLDFERPFAFFSRVLYAEGGLRRFHARLGSEVDDVIAEFLSLALDHEQDVQPSLQGFLATTRAREISIRRDLAEGGGGVRVMTVHGAKGLEAPIVILADAATRPSGRQLQKPLFVLSEPKGPLLVHASGDAEHVPATRALRDAAREALAREYWRKLYVGMTRAEEALYVTGPLTVEGKLEGSWYEAVEAALRPLARIETGIEGEETALVFPADTPDPPRSEAATHAVPGPALPLDLPDAPLSAVPPVVRPSSAFAGDHRDHDVFESAAESLREAEAARLEGIALHALLQHLGGVPPGARARVLERAMPELLPDRPELHGAMAKKAVSILSNPGFAALFGPDSRAELPFLLAARRGEKPVRLAGRIDRVVAEAGRVLVVDYKSDAAPPAAPEAVPRAYLTQLGLYALAAGRLFPGRRVEAGILWTGPESLMIVPPALLAAAAGAFTLK